jgi:hypothetical protein
MLTLNSIPTDSLRNKNCLVYLSLHTQTVTYSPKHSPDVARTVIVIYVQCMRQCNIKLTHDSVRYLKHHTHNNTITLRIAMSFTYHLRNLSNHIRQVFLKSTMDIAKAYITLYFRWYIVTKKIIYVHNTHTHTHTYIHTYIHTYVRT